MTEHEFDVGEWVTDDDPPRGNDDPPVMLVIDHYDEPAAEVPVYTEPDGSVHSVSDANDGKWPESPVVKVVFREGLNRRLIEENPGWTVEEVIGLYNSGELTTGRGAGGYGLMAYSYPEARLKPHDDD